MTEANVEIKSFIEPTVERIRYHIQNATEKQNSTGMKELVLHTSIAETRSITDYWCAKVYFGIFNNEDLISERSLNFIIFQNIKTHDVSITITSDNDLNLIFKSITKYPKDLIDKYLPNIIQSTYNILTKGK